ncbi:hypothetical protein GGR51DRAFT_521655 [Nemania sp. FL0031]|nr:hypothetical protein GGR51DRAFT_521655 [Nemania sp. FL0031]
MFWLLVIVLWDESTLGGSSALLVRAGRRENTRPECALIESYRRGSNRFSTRYSNAMCLRRGPAFGVRQAWARVRS